MRSMNKHLGFNGTSSDEGSWCKKQCKCKEPCRCKEQKSFVCPSSVINIPRTETIPFLHVAASLNPPNDTEQEIIVYGNNSGLNVGSLFANFNPASGVFTVPKDGIYSVTATATFR